MDKRKDLPQTRSPRHRFEATVELPEGRGRVLNISNSGLFFELDEPLELGRTLHVSLILNDLHPMPPVQLEAAARVVRVERLDGKAGIGIEFTSIRFENADTWTALRADEER
ncbi:MAG: hypothetical protein DME04_12400 [Candidatus Rokuibacteriota bacterium]|nr:MAG: hypothetical protein DME04_12400 [Candidatus Rokubacteria bacterium]